MPSALIKPSLSNANKCPSSTLQLTIKVICSIHFLEHKKQRLQPAHRGNNHAVLLQEINRPFNMAINLQSGKKIDDSCQLGRRSIQFQDALTLLGGARVMGAAGAINS